MSEGSWESLKLHVVRMWSRRETRRVLWMRGAAQNSKCRESAELGNGERLGHPCLLAFQVASRLLLSGLLIFGRSGPWSLEPGAHLPAPPNPARTQRKPQP